MWCVCVSIMEDPDGYRNCSGAEGAQITAMLSWYPWKLTRKCQKGHYWKPGWMVFFFEVCWIWHHAWVRTNSILGFLNCKLCGFLLKCSGISHYPRQCVYNHVTPHKWIAISFFFVFLSRPSLSEVLKGARNTELVSTLLLFLQALIDARELFQIWTSVTQKCGALQ